MYLPKPSIHPVNISTGFLLAYDFAYIYQALPLVYDASDKIVLTLDSQRKTLTGQHFDVDPWFFTWLKGIDKDNKITLLQQPFYNQELSPLEVIMSMRNSMLQAMSPATWYVQLDADEYFIDFPGFVQYLLQLPPSEHIQLVHCKWKTLFKLTKKGFLAIGGKAETVPIAINTPINNSERSHSDSEIINSSYFILHQSWARPSEEIAKKIANWSHTLDFNTQAFYHFWHNITEVNYKLKRHFHPLHPPIWPFLELVPTSSIEKLICYYKQHPPVESATPPLPLRQRIWNRVSRIFSKTKPTRVY